MSNQNEQDYIEEQNRMAYDEAQNYQDSKYAEHQELIEERQKFAEKVLSEHNLPTKFSYRTAFLLGFSQRLNESNLLKEDMESTMVDLDIVDFQNTNKCHDWRNHVSTQFINNWHLLTIREKYIIFSIASDVANNQEYE